MSDNDTIWMWVPFDDGQDAALLVVGKRKDVKALDAMIDDLHLAIASTAELPDEMRQQLIDIQHDDEQTELPVRVERDMTDEWNDALRSAWDDEG